MDLPRELKSFPLDPSARFTFEDTWGAPRDDGRTHEGTDIFAAEGTPVHAVVAGIVTAASTDVGGLVVYLEASADRTRYYYAHLSGIAGHPWPRHVTPGDVIGYVGRTGNAATTKPHLHFGIYLPAGRGAINPFESLRLALGTPARSPSRSSTRRKPSPIGVLIALWLLHEIGRG